MGWIVMAGAVLIVLCLSRSAVGDGGRRPEDFARQWVRNHPFTITAAAIEAESLDPKQYRDAGMSQMMIWKDPDDDGEIFRKAAGANLPWHYYAMKNRKRARLPFHLLLTDQEKARARMLYDTHPGCIGWVIWDEPRHPAFKTMADAMTWFRRTFPDTLVYTGIYSAGANPGKYYNAEIDPATGDYGRPPVPYTYETYLQEYVDLCRPDVLMTDPYPCVEVEQCDAATWISTRFFLTLERIRVHAQKAGIPYWIFVQAFNILNSKYYYPSESDVRMQVYSALAYGFTGIAYFLYHNPGWPWALLDSEGTPAPLFEKVKKLNGEVANLGRALRFLTSTGVRHVSGRHYCPGSAAEEDFRTNPLPRGAKPFDAAAGKPCQITDVRVYGVGAGRDGLIGFFQDDSGGRYFMPVNLRRSRNLSADDTKARLTMTFEPSVSSIWRLSRQTGRVEQVPLDHGTLDLTLPGGTGDLFKIEDAEFPGLGPS